MDPADGPDRVDGSDRAEWEGVWRREAPHTLSALLRRHGPARFADCEDAVQEALLAAATQWPRDGAPDDPRAWLVRVASRRLIDQIRSEVSRREREERDARLATAGRAEPDGSDRGSEDDVFELMMLCCHPALSKASQVALMLRAVSGLSTAEIAAGFLVPEATMAQRISRAKASIARSASGTGTGATFPVPEASDRTARMSAVRHAIALLFTEAHTRTSGPAVTDRADTDAAITLARQLVSAQPSDPENSGLLALLLISRSRTRWDPVLVSEGVALLERALPVGPVGEFQLQATIAAVHAEAATWDETDWPQIAELYRMLDTVAPSLSVSLGRAAAIARVSGPDEGLTLLDELSGPQVARHHRYHAVRGHLLAEAGRTEQAVAALTEAARLTRSIPEQRYLHRVIAGFTREQPRLEPGPA